MRNLALLDLAIIPLPSSRGTIVDVAFNLDDGSQFVITENVNGDADVDWEIWRLESEQNAKPTSCTTLRGSYTSLPNSFGSNQLASSKFLADEGVLVLITRGGDIASWNTTEEDAPVEVVGSVEEGISVAAWSPDETVLVLVTGHSKIILMTPTFDVLSEGPLHPADFGSDAPINVGWGSKQTQFHGSLGKSAAQAPSAPLVVGVSPDDDALPRISWRGDGAFFTVSSLSPKDSSHRTLRVYDRAGELQSTSEAVPGLEHTLAWRPSGSLIASTQRFGFPGGGVGKMGRHDLVFFERNGLRHGEFAIRPPIGAVMAGDASGHRKWGYRAKDLLWSAGSDVLALWLESEIGDIVQLWTTGNYHWYLKQEIVTPRSDDGQQSCFTSVIWHPEEALTLILTTSKHVLRRVYASEVWGSSTEIPYDSGSVVVVDGENLLLTPFRTQNVPPPMSSGQLLVSASSEDRPKTPVHAALSAEKDVLAVLHEDGNYQVWDLQTRLGPGKGPVVEPVLLRKSQHDENKSYASWRQVELVGRPTLGDDVPWSVAMLGRRWNGGDVVTVRGASEDREISVEPGGRLLQSSPSGSIWWQSSTGVIQDLLRSDEVDAAEPTFTEFCAEARVVSTSPSPVFVGLSRAARLHVSTPSKHRVLGTNVTSFASASGFIIYTTSAHEAHFVPLDEIAAEKEHDVVEKRRIERGARIVSAVPSALSLVLQMPRGNLETIAPRPMVMAVVHRDIAAGEWKKAFVACRKHRIDLAVLVNDTKSFLASIPTFVRQIDDVDFFGLFLTTISRSALPQDTINRVCDAMREELESVDLIRFTNAVLTAGVVKSPPQHEEALRMLLRLRNERPEVVDDALKYLVFLVDADVLFDVALGMYDFGLVLLVAQLAKKDPREYLPFLRHLHSLPSLPAQRFAIDDHLRRHSLALAHLHEAGEERFAEAMTYAARHRLLPEALKLWAGSARESDVLEAYGEDLLERREWRAAALVFVRAGRTGPALAAYERALDWRELFDLAISTGMSSEQIQELGYRIADDLGSKKRHEEAGRVLLEYCADVRQSVIAFVEAGAFAEARRVVAEHKRSAAALAEVETEQEDLMETIVVPGLLDAASMIMEGLEEMRVQMEKQQARVKELRKKKAADPDVFYGEDNPALADVDVMTDVSQPGTAYTRYTVAPTTASRTSTKRSSRAKRKADRNTGKKGTAEEEEYLLRSVCKLVARFAASSAEIDALVPHLLHFTLDHRATARRLLNTGERLRTTLVEAVDEIWTRAPLAAPEEVGLAERLAGQGRVEAMDKVHKPDPPRSSEWHSEVVDALVGM